MFETSNKIWLKRLNQRISKVEELNLTKVLKKN